MSAVTYLTCSGLSMGLPTSTSTVHQTFRSSCTSFSLILYITFAHPVHHFRSSCTSFSLILYITSAHPVHHFRSSCTSFSLILYITSAHPVHHFRSSCTSFSLILYITSAHPVHHFRSSCTSFSLILYITLFEDRSRNQVSAHTITQSQRGSSGNPQLSQNAYQEGYRIHRSKAKVLEIETNSRYKKYRKSAHMTCLLDHFSHHTLEISLI